MEVILSVCPCVRASLFRFTLLIIGLLQQTITWYKIRRTGGQAHYYSRTGTIQCNAMQCNAIQYNTLLTTPHGSFSVTMQLREVTIVSKKTKINSKTLYLAFIKIKQIYRINLRQEPF